MPLDHAPVVYSLFLCPFFVQGMLSAVTTEFAAFQFVAVRPPQVATGEVIVRLASVALETNEVILRHGEEYKVSGIK